MQTQNTSATGGEGGNASQPSGSGTLLSNVQRTEGQNSGTGAGNQPPAQNTGETGGQQPPGNISSADWRAALSDDLKNDDNLKTIHDVNALAKSYVHAQKMIGANKVPLPGKHASEDDIQRFYDQIGRPPLDKYEVALPKNAKFVDKAIVDELKPVAHKLGLMPNQLQGVMEWIEGKNQTLAEQMQQSSQVNYEKEVNSLKTEWGKTFESRLAYGERVLQEVAGPELTQYLKDKGLNNDIKLVKLLGTIGEKLYKEDTPPGDGTGGSGSFYDPSTAQAKYNEIIGDFNHPYHKAEHPKHNAAVQEVMQLMAMAFPQPTS